MKVAINPQIVLSDWGYKSEFERITSCILDEDILGRLDCTDYMRTGRNILIMNVRSKLDMEQLEKLCKKLSIDVKYGINVFDNLIIWLYDASLGDPENAHSLSEFYCVLFVIEWVIHNIENKELLCNNESLIRLVNEFWYYRYKFEMDMKKKIPDFLQIKKCLAIKKKKAVWGIGNIGRDFLVKTLEVVTSNYLDIEYIIDSNSNISDLYGLRICSPEAVENWDDVFVIIAVERGKDEIIYYLKNKGMQYGEDFMLYSDLYKK